MKKSWVLALCVTAALAACGGGDDDTPPVTEAVPPNVNASSANFVDYLKQLVVASADTLEPVDVSAATPPADDTGDASILN